MGAKSNTETEIKIAVPDFRRVRERLKRLGFRQAGPRRLETNLLFDTKSAELRGAGRLLRLRRIGGKAILTFKGPAQTGRHKSREELEIEVSDAAKCQALLEGLGFVPTFRYEKRRTEYTDGDGVVTLDQTPIGAYVELEGDGTWIDRSAAALGYGEADYITSSYGRLYVEYCAAHGIAPGDMVFRETPRRRRGKTP